MARLSYVVKIGWRCEFEFDDMEDAGSFAIQAAAHRTANSDKDEIIIKIKDNDPDEEVSDETDNV